MATLNHFKTLNKICLNYFNIAKLKLEISEDLKEIDQKRLGFYYFILECTSGIREIDEIDKLITDTEYNKIIYNKKDDDFGIDAVHINEDINEITLYNFKFREKFDVGKKQSENELITSSKFLYALKNRSVSNLKGKIKKEAEKIIKKIDSDDEWKINLVMASNESMPIEVNRGAIEEFKRALDLEVKTCILDDIVKYMSLTPENINSEFISRPEDCFKSSESKLGTSVSFILKISLAELIRITCDDKNIRERKNTIEIEDENLLKLNLDSNILFDNVRSFLGSTKYNLGIKRTLEEEPEKFFMFNNGITMTAKTIESKEMNGGNKVKINLEGMQIVNGGQSLRSIVKFKESLKKEEIKKLYDTHILVRVFKVSDSDELARKVAEYTNSQNSISIIDLKSLGGDQVLIEKYLAEHKILYKRKLGEVKIEKIDYVASITLEKLGQILYSINGRPYSASNSKKKIFELYYEETFKELKFDDLPEIVINSKKILEKIDKNGKKISDQKMFYVMYLLKKTDNIYNIDEILEFLDNTLDEYQTQEELSQARKLLLKDFKENLDIRLEELNKKISL